MVKPRNCSGTSGKLALSIFVFNFVFEIEMLPKGLSYLEGQAGKIQTTIL